MKPEATGETRGWCGLDDGAETRWTCVVSRKARGKFWNVVLVRVPPTLLCSFEYPLLTYLLTYVAE